MIKINTKDFKAVLEKLKSVVSSNSTLSILENFLFIGKGGKFYYGATDLEMQFKTSTPMGKGEDYEFECLLPIIPVHALINKIKDEFISMEITEKKIILKHSRGQYSIALIHPEEYPKLSFDKPDGESLGIINSAILGTALEKVLFGASTDDTRMALNGIHFVTSKKNLKLESTNGHLICKYTQSGEGFIDETKHIVPKKVLSFIQAWDGSFDLEVIKVGNKLAFYCDTFMVDSALIDGQYPDIAGAVPQKLDKQATIDKKTLLLALQRLSIIAECFTQSCIFSFSKGVLNLKGASVGYTGVEEIECKYIGDDLKISFNYNYFITILNHLDSETITIELLNNKTVIVMYDAAVKQVKYFYVLAPLRMDETDE